MEERKDFIHEEILEREERISNLKRVLEGELDEKLRVFLEAIEPEDIAEILNEFSPEEKLRIFGSLNAEAAAVVLDDTDPQTRLQVLQKLDDKKLSKILDESAVRVSNLKIG